MTLTEYRKRKKEPRRKEKKRVALLSIPRRVNINIPPIVVRCDSYVIRARSTPTPPPPQFQLHTPLLSLSRSDSSPRGSIAVWRHAAADAAAAATDTLFGDEIASQSIEDEARDKRVT